MSNQVNGPCISVVLGEAVTAPFTIIKLVSGEGTLTTGVASADNAAFGIAQETGAIGDSIQVRCINCVATSKVKVAGAITKGDGVFTAANGLGTDATTSLTRIGMALDAATAANDVIEVAHVAGGNDDLT